MTVFATAYMGLIAFLKLKGFGYLTIGLFISIQALVSLALRVVAGRLADRYLDKVAFTGLLVVTVAFIMITINPLPPSIYFAAVVYGAGVFIPSSQTLALHRAPLVGRGFLSGVYTMGLDAGNLIGLILFGLLIQVYGSYDVVFKAAPLLSLAASLIVILPLEVKTKIYS